MAADVARLFAVRHLAPAAHLTVVIVEICVQLDGFVHGLLEGVLRDSAGYVASCTAGVRRVCVHAGTWPYATTRHHVAVRIFGVEACADPRLEDLVP